jgi:hypothetical protein
LKNFHPSQGAGFDVIGDIVANAFAAKGDGGNYGALRARI